MMVSIVSRDKKHKHVPLDRPSLFFNSVLLYNNNPFFQRRFSFLDFVLLLFFIFSFLLLAETSPTFFCRNITTFTMVREHVKIYSVLNSLICLDLIIRIIDQIYSLKEPSISRFFKPRVSIFNSPKGFYAVHFFSPLTGKD